MGDQANDFFASFSLTEEENQTYDMVKGKFEPYYILLSKMLHVSMKEPDSTAEFKQVKAELERLEKQVLSLRLRSLPTGAPQLWWSQNPVEKSGCVLT